MSGPENIPAPMYDGATQEALNQDIEGDLDDNKILADHAAQSESNQDVYARQALLRSQAELAAANAKVEQLTTTTQSLAQDTQYMKGQLDALSQGSTASQAQAKRDAELQQFALSDTEQASFGESLPAIEKIVGRALYEQEHRLRNEFASTLSSHTEAAVAPLKEELGTVKQSNQLSQENQQRAFDTQVKSAFAMRGTSLEATIADPTFQEKAAQRIPGSNVTFFQQFKANAESGNLDGMMDFVDYAMKDTQVAQPGFAPPAGNTRTPTTAADNANLAKRNELQATLERMELDNSTGRHEKYGGKSKFVEERNKVLLEIEKYPLT